MKTILIPVDGSHFAEQALAHAHLIAQAFHAQVHLLEVIPDLERERRRIDSLTFIYAGNLAGEQIRLSHEAAMELRAHTESYLQQLAAPLEADGLHVAVHVLMGHAAEDIARFAEDIHAELIVMATHGYSGVKRWTLGSVADKVIHASKVPMLLVRGNQHQLLSPLALRRVLVPFDGSALSMQALPIARELVQCTAADLLLLHVVDPATETIPAVGMDGAIFAMHATDRHTPNLPDISTALEERRQRASHSLEHLLETMGNKPQHMQALSVIGYPAEVIVDEAERHQVDLIVMATHGYSGIKRWALGSVADKVLHSTQTPLLLVRTS